MSLDIRKPTVAALRPQIPSRPTRTASYGGVWLALAIAMACALAWGLTPQAHATLAARTAALQALMAQQGYDPRLLFQTNAPFGAILPSAPDPASLWTFGHALALFETAAFQALAVASALLCVLGLACVARRRANRAAYALGGTLALMAPLTLASGGLPLDWFRLAIGMGLMGMAWGMRTKARPLAGVLLGAAVAIHPVLLLAAAGAAVALVRAVRPQARQQASLGLGVGGLLLALLASPPAAAVLWAAAAGGLMAGWLPRRRAWMAAWIAGVCAQALACHALGMEGVATAAVVGVGALALVLLAGLRPVRVGGKPMVGHVPLALATLALGGIGILVDAGASGPTPGNPGAALLPLAVLALGLIPTGGAISLGLGALAVGGVLWAQGPGDPEAREGLCPAQTVRAIAQGLEEMEAQRVLTTPLLGWQLLMDGHTRAGMVASGTGPGGGADAAHALGDTTPDGEEARRIAMRRSVAAIALCGEPATAGLASSLWRGNRADLAPLAGWVTPFAEGDGYGIYATRPETAP